MKISRFLLKKTTATAFLVGIVFSIQAQNFTNDSSVIAIRTANSITIDGIANEVDWDKAKWYNMDIPWLVPNQNGGLNVAPDKGATWDANDFTGKFKVLWSEATNKIYFTVHIIDNSLVKGATIDNAYWEYDVVEIFVDENGPCRSGNCDHQANNSAYAYHVSAGTDESEFDVFDVGVDVPVVMFNEVFDVKIVETEPNHFIWEMSMDLVDEDGTNVLLQEGKKIGFAIAYCDSDSPNSPKRELFAGNVFNSGSNKADLWMDASLFGGLSLASEPTAINDNAQYYHNFSIAPNPCTDVINITLNQAKGESINLELFDVLGKKIVQKQYSSPIISVPISEMPKGIYYLKLNGAKFSETIRIIKK